MELWNEVITLVKADIGASVLEESGGHAAAFWEGRKISRVCEKGDKQMSLRDELLKKAEEMAAAKLGMDPKQVEDNVNSLLKQSGIGGSDDSDSKNSSNDEDEKPARRNANSDNDSSDDDDRSARKNAKASDDDDSSDEYDRPARKNAKSSNDDARSNEDDSDSQKEDSEQDSDADDEQK